MRHCVRGINYPSIADLFFETYPEFDGYVSSDRVEAVARKAFILYPVLHNGCCENYRLASCMVVGHLLIRGGLVIGSEESSGLGSNVNGVVQSANVDSVSVGFQAKPIHNLAEDYFASTPYGLEFLAWLATISGVDYINH